MVLHSVNITLIFNIFILRSRIASLRSLRYAPFTCARRARALARYARGATKVTDRNSNEPISGRRAYSPPPTFSLHSARGPCAARPSLAVFLSRRARRPYGRARCEGSQRRAHPAPPSVRMFWRNISAARKTPKTELQDIPLHGVRLINGAPYGAHEPICGRLRRLAVAGRYAPNSCAPTAI